MAMIDHYSIVIGRFQTPILHIGHREMLAKAANFGQPLVGIGVSPITPSAAQPLSYKTRAGMIRNEQPEAIVFPVNDHVSDVQWARNFSDKIFTLIAGSFIQEKDVDLHFIVGKDSAFSHLLDGGPFSGYDFIESTLRRMCDDLNANLRCYRTLLPEIETSSATELRESVATDGPLTSGVAFNEGVIWATQKRFPTAYMCVDIAALDERKEEILLIQKYEGGPWMLPGGFTEPSTNTPDPVVTDAARELYEETNILVVEEELEFLGHFRIDDWRYRKEADKINTTLYRVDLDADVLYSAHPGDDAYDVKVFKYDGGNWTNNIDRHQIAQSHKPLITAATGYKFK